MVGKRVQFDDETWVAVEAVMHDTRSSFQDIADEAFADLLKKHKQRPLEQFNAYLIRCRTPAPRWPRAFAGAASSSGSRVTAWASLRA
jgi:hypothetical protein